MYSYSVYLYCFIDANNIELRGGVYLNDGAMDTGYIYFLVRYTRHL